MWKTIFLILPVLVPSWRFFKTIEPSPRVQWALLPVGSAAGVGGAIDWREFRARPEIVSPLQMARRLFWNPAWNETLFLVSCAERIQGQPTQHSITEIQQRILRDIMRRPIDVADKMLQFRLVFVHRDDVGISNEVVFVSDTFMITGGEIH